MSPLRVLLAGSLSLAVAAALAAVTPLAMKPGLWLMTVQMQTSGMRQVPAAAMAHMTPEQKARIAAMGGPHTFKECITAEQLLKGFDASGQRNPPGHTCARSVVSSSTSALAMHIVCTGGQATTTGDGTFQTGDGVTVRGTMNMTVNRAGHPAMVMKSTITGKWLASDCAGIKPGEVR